MVKIYIYTEYSHTGIDSMCSFLNWDDAYNYKRNKSAQFVIDLVKDVQDGGNTSNIDYKQNPRCDAVSYDVFPHMNPNVYRRMCNFFEIREIELQ